MNVILIARKTVRLAVFVDCIAGVLVYARPAAAQSNFFCERMAKCQKKIGLKVTIR